MVQKLTLAARFHSVPGTDNWEVVGHESRYDDGVVIVRLKGNGGDNFKYVFSKSRSAPLLRSSINGDLSVTSLFSLLYQALIDETVFVGSISGDPD